MHWWRCEPQRLNELRSASIPMSERYEATLLDSWDGTSAPPTPERYGFANATA